MMVETRPVGFGLFGFGLCWLSLFFSPPSDCSSLPSTMTWAPCPHGVRTRGKKRCNSCKRTPMKSWLTPSGAHYVPTSVLYVIARQCFVEAVHKGHFMGEAKAIRVPFGKNDKFLPQAFSFHTEVRHVQVEAGIRIVGAAAWRSCQRLQVVHLPDTVVCLRHGAFRRCYVLRAVTAPGC